MILIGGRKVDSLIGLRSFSYSNWSLLADVMREGILELWRIEYADITVEDGEYILMEGKVFLLLRPAPDELQRGGS